MSLAAELLRVVRAYRYVCGRFSYCVLLARALRECCAGLLTAGTAPAAAQAW